MTVGYFGNPFAKCKIKFFAARLFQHNFLYRENVANLTRKANKGFDAGAHNTLKKVLNLWNNPDCPPIAMSQLLKACTYYTKGVARGGLGLKACPQGGRAKRLRILGE